MFLFCYHARGMCFVDMAFLRKSDLRGDTIVYRRHKTAQRIELHVLPAMRRIIDWFAPYTAGSHYLFPIITDGDKDVMLQYDSGLRLQNQRLKKIARLHGIKNGLSTHSARHSWATVAKSVSLPLAVISEGLGHSNQRTTEIYLASLERSVLDYASRVVSDAILPGTPGAKRPKHPGTIIPASPLIPGAPIIHVTKTTIHGAKSNFR
jgi:integrase